MEKAILCFVIGHDLYLTITWFIGLPVMPAFVSGLIFFIILLYLQIKNKRKIL